MRTFIQYSFYPVLLVITIVTFWVCIEYLPKDYIILIPPIALLTTLPMMILGEFFLTYRKDWDEARGEFWSDMFSSLVVLPWATKAAELLLPMLLYYPMLWMINAGWISLSKFDYGFWGMLVVALAFSELFYYWAHRLFHVIPVLWRFHSIHHGADRVYWMNAGRFHVIEAFINGFFYYFPLIFFGIHPEVIVCVITISGVTGFAEHINVDFKAGPLNYIFNTAQHHRWHHSKIVKESNKNYGKALVIWDMIFGTFYLPKGKAVVDVGVDEVVPGSVKKQFLFPFRKMKKG